MHKDIKNLPVVQSTNFEKQGIQRMSYYKFDKNLCVAILTNKHLPGVFSVWGWLGWQVIYQHLLSKMQYSGLK